MPTSNKEETSLKKKDTRRLTTTNKTKHENERVDYRDCHYFSSFGPIDGNTGPTFQGINDYAPFYNEAHVATGFKRVNFTEVNNVAENVADMLEHQPPFNDIKIPAQGPILKGIGLAVILGIFITLNLLPESGIPDSLVSC